MGILHPQKTMKKKLTDSELNYCNAEGIPAADFVKKKLARKTKSKNRGWKHKFVFYFPSISNGWIVRLSVIEESKNSITILGRSENFDLEIKAIMDYVDVINGAQTMKRLLVEQALELFPGKKLRIFLKQRAAINMEPTLIYPV